METFETLHPAAQVTLIICGCIVAVVFVLARYTDFFNKKK
jgi:hypothetical protein